MQIINFSTDLFIGMSPVCRNRPVSCKRGGKLTIGMKERMKGINGFSFIVIFTYTIS